MNANTDILGAIVALIVAAWPLAKVIIQHKVTPDALAHIQDIARLAVRGAEEMSPWLAAVVHDVPAAKLDLASNALTSGAKRLGVKLTTDEVVAFVHAALREMEDISASAAA